MKCVALAIALLFVVILLLPLNVERVDTGRIQTGNNINELISAIRGYHSVYGKYPELETPGIVETEAANASLIKILSGQEGIRNPKGLAFLDYSTRCSKNGILAETDAYVDAWNNHYRARFDTDADGYVESPYGKSRTDVIVWSLGKDGIQGSNEGSDDVIPRRAD